LLDRYVPAGLWARLRPDAVLVWDDVRVRRALSWYYAVMRDDAPAKFLLAKLVEVPERIDDMGLEELKDARRSYRRELEGLVTHALHGKYSLEDYRRDSRSPPSTSLLDVDVRIVKLLSKPCRLCERRCGVDREKSIGACRLDYNVYVHSWFHHLGEEPPLVPSGTIFYGGCNFTCVYCQNYDISQVYPRMAGRVDARRLALIQRELRVHGARNINHVGGEPTPSLHVIVESFKFLDVNVPQIWNSNMYMTLDATLVLSDLIDLWLPDFKYGNNKCALRLSAVPNYFEVVTRNLKIAAENGDMIIRHLVLPGHVECCTRRVLEWIASNLRLDKVLVNIMDQYRPEHMVLKYPRRWREIARSLRRDEIEEAYSIASRLGIVYEPVS